MAKVERQFSRATAALADEEHYDDVFRPHAVSRPRPLSSLEETVAAGPLAEEDDEELPVLRTRRRVPVKRGRMPKGRLGRILVVAGIAGAFAMVIALGVTIHNFFMTDARFEIDSASSIQVLGNAQVTRPELLSVFGSDIGRNIFHVPLAARRAELEQLPWVERATVMRLLPNQLRVAVIERTPVAFVREGNQIGLVDRKGVLLNMPPAMMAAKRYSFPVLTGVMPQQTPEERASRMRLYSDFMNAMASTEAGAVSQLSEVDLSDPEDVQVLLPSAGSDLLVHFGSDDFAVRWQRLREKLPEWRRQYPQLAGVDLRYQRQTVLEMAKTPEAAASSAPAQPAAKAPSHPVIHSRPDMQRGKLPQTHKQPVKKTMVKKKPVHAAAHGSTRQGPAAHRGTNG